MYQQAIICQLFEWIFMVNMINFQNSMSLGQMMNALSEKKDRVAFRNKEKKNKEQMAKL